MDRETIYIWNDAARIGTLVRHVRTDGVARPAMLVIPGGGYGMVCEGWEGTPIADRFDEMGYSTFVLDYHTANRGGHFPEPLDDAARAMKLIRGNAAKWNVKPDQVGVVGFSAGAHLALSLGTIAIDGSAAKMAGHEPGVFGDEFDSVPVRPNAMIGCYPVVSAKEFTPDGRRFAHLGSSENYFGVKKCSKEQIEFFSLEDHVTAATPPAFLWSTVEDELVPMQNAIYLHRALSDAKIPADLHVFPHGAHGMQLGNGHRDIALWPEMAGVFLTDTCGFTFDQGATK